MCEKIYRDRELVRIGWGILMPEPFGDGGLKKW